MVTAFEANLDRIDGRFHARGNALNKQRGLVA